MGNVEKIVRDQEWFPKWVFTDFQLVHFRQTHAPFVLVSSLRHSGVDDRYVPLYCGRWIIFTLSLLKPSFSTTISLDIWSLDKKSIARWPFGSHESVSPTKKTLVANLRRIKAHNWSQSPARADNVDSSHVRNHWTSSLWNTVIDVKEQHSPCYFNVEQIVPNIIVIIVVVFCECKDLQSKFIEPRWRSLKTNANNKLLLDAVTTPTHLLHFNFFSKGRTKRFMCF